TFVYTIEACNTFHPSSSYLDQVCDENFDAALYLLQEAENINNVIPRVIPPKINETSDESDGYYTVSWNEKNYNANPDYFQLDELTGLSFINDNAESDSDLWTLDGFSISTSESHSSSHSYKSHYSNADCSSMTSNYPVPITEEMNLSFWCWYDIEDDYDMAFVEVSREGRAYDLLDKFTGSSSGWIYKEYSLSDYINESVFIRLRYTTDTNTLNDGIYFDDISPVPDFASINMLSNSITDNFYDITGNQEGTYYYRVRGHNSEHGWGDFSTLKRINVAVENNEPPNKPIINGPTSGNINVEYIYTASATDPNGNRLYYIFDWGDGKFSGWIGPYNSGETAEASHKWNKKGDYEIRVKSKDEYTVESEWSDSLPISMPKVESFKIPYVYLLQKLIGRFPLFERMFKPMFFN
ncbi:MAG: immune inhibitor A, partial [Thermoplasmatales archaeon]|nr:immune inhibitor A [Thermoplasmatales archaeon]